MPSLNSSRLGAMSLVGALAFVVACSAAPDEESGEGSQHVETTGAIDCSQRADGFVGCDEKGEKVYRCQASRPVLQETCEGAQICFDDGGGRTAFCRGDFIDCSSGGDSNPHCFGQGTATSPFQVWQCVGRAAVKVDQCIGAQICYDNQAGTAFCRGDAVDCGRTPAGTKFDSCLGSGAAGDPFQIWECDGPQAKKLDQCVGRQICFDDGAGISFCKGDP